MLALSLLDGLLDAPMWSAAESIGSLTMTEPIEGGQLVGRTTAVDRRRVRFVDAASDGLRPRSRPNT